MPDIFIAKDKIKKEKSKSPLTPKLRSELEAEKAVTWGRKIGILSVVAFRPPYLRFDDQDPDEEIIIFVRRHLITNLKWFLMVILLSLIPLLAFALLDFDLVPLNFRFIGFLVWYLLVFAFGFERFLVWFFNINIVTNKRIVDVNVPNILFRDITQMPLENIQDITAETGGFMRSILAFGDVRIQTAGTVPEVSFEAVPSPNKLAQILNDLWGEVK